MYALAIIPILIVFFVFAMLARKRSIERFGDSSLMAQLMPKMSKYKHTVKFVLLMIGLAFLVIGWANPQWGTKKEKVKRKSVDVFVALDISQSMMAEDIPPNRMERAKRFAQDLIEELKGDRVGLIIFAGNAYLQMPLTTDYAAAKLFLRTANPDMAPSQGTAISDAIDLAYRSFEEDNKAHKALVIITDGENHDQDALDQAQSANEDGLLIFTVGVGTPQGAKIPVNYGGRQGYKIDKTGQEVVSKLNEQMLLDLASEGDGSYFNIAAGDKVVETLQERIDKLEKREFETRAFEEYESYFQYFIGLALLFLIIEFVISYRKNKFLEGKDFFQ
jgi:Ca-activated chloride channel family protein